MSVRIAVVGSGPAGFYLADFLSKSGAAVDLLERLPFPYGLVRYGVAPDHQGTKAVVRNFARVMERPGVRFLGGVEVGRDVSLEELRGNYGAVVLAVGAAAGKGLGCPGATRVVTGFALLRWINGHPDAPPPDLPDRLRTALIVGHGNVALDCARLLLLPAERLAETDAAEAFVAWRRRQQVERVVLVGRGGPGDARFSPEMLAELQGLPGVALLRGPLPAAAVEPGNVAAAEFLAGLPQAAEAGAKVEFRFGLRPLACEGGRLTLVGAAGTRETLEGELLVAAVGQSAAGLAAAPWDEAGSCIANVEGQVTGLPGVFVAGWASGHARGTIPDARAAARALAPAVLAAAAASPSESRDLLALLRRRGVGVADWAAWQAHDRRELEAGEAAGACRRKLAAAAGLPPVRPDETGR